MAYLTDKEPTGLTAKTTPIDADVVIIGDSADASEVAKQTTWANIKATLKTYFDTLYAGVLGADDNYVTDAEKAALHPSVTVTDSSEINFTLTGQDITASIVAGSIDETKLDVSTNASLDLADSSVQPSSSPSFGTVTATVEVVSPELRASSSAGVLLEANNGTDVGILGVGNTANVEWSGSHNFSTATQDTIAGFTGAGKTLGSLALATYPSLTELSYVKGVTSAIQTQLNALGGITRTVVVTSGSATMGSTASTDYVYFVAGAHTMSLPAASGNTNRYTVKNNHSAAITIDTVGAETIDGSASIQIAPEDSVDIISNGTNFNVV